MAKWNVRVIPLQDSGKNVQENNLRSRVISFFTLFSMLEVWGSHKRAAESCQKQKPEQLSCSVGPKSAALTWDKGLVSSVQEKTLNLTGPVLDYCRGKSSELAPACAALPGLSRLVGGGSSWILMRTEHQENVNIDLLSLEAWLLPPAGESACRTIC